VGIKLGGFDFLYMPSRDVEADLDFYTGVLGGEAVWAIERFGTRVARVGLSEGGPQLILAQHLEGDAPMQLHRVESLDDAIAGLQNEGVPVSGRFGFPYGEAVEFTAPGGQRLAVYELTRPEVEEKLVGRFDFWRS
jgi:catechol 2,3-dioxygenase-like lactoylglutathione lyase family enzyme